ncbi:hypothetical protein [Phocaeicola plebeius]|uniref:hypothetical protein n=1 Tax=Phocaeicola plebeius TaxID=310297 RepID=UPI0026EBA09B|nr:hypothetical protein [Phocaeicola plebeius]
MRKSKIIYNPLLSVKENAENNHVSISAIRWYIRTNGIDRKRDNAIAISKSIANYKKSNPTATMNDISTALELSVNTVRKYVQNKINKSNIDNSKLSTFDLSKRKFIISSISDSQDEILSNILRLHIKQSRFDCDLTYSIGVFYKHIPQPKLKFDKYPQVDDVRPLDEFNNIEDGSLHSIVIDLPFVIKGKEVNYKSMMADRFNCFSNAKELYDTNTSMLQLAYSKLSKEGILVFKTMDIIYGGVPHWIGNYVQNKAIEIGFKLVDMFILFAKTKVLTNVNTTQLHARKFHSYFFVLEKR